MQRSFTPMLRWRVHRRTPSTLGGKFRFSDSYDRAERFQPHSQGRSGYGLRLEPRYSLLLCLTRREGILLSVNACLGDDGSNEDWPNRRPAQGVGIVWVFVPSREAKEGERARTM